LCGFGVLGFRFRIPGTGFGFCGLRIGRQEAEEGEGVVLGFRVQSEGFMGEKARERRI
jgi:hypothetical protein